MISYDHPFIIRLKHIDATAVRELVDTYYERINRYVYGLVQNPQVAAELTQETFLRAYRAAPRLAEDSNLSAWLFRIATNLARQHHRRRRLIEWLPLFPSASRQESFEQRVAETDLMRYVLGQLPDTYRVCLLLQAWNGFDCAEIAFILGKSESAVRMTLMRARRRFRELYDKESQ